MKELLKKFWHALLEMMEQYFPPRPGVPL